MNYLSEEQRKHFTSWDYDSSIRGEMLGMNQYVLGDKVKVNQDEPVTVSIDTGGHLDVEDGEED